MILESAILCLSLNVFHEARGEPIKGQFAVGQVTLNRAERKPECVCKVVYAPAQFTWTSSRPVVKPEDRGEFEHAKAIAELSFYMSDFTGGADHYHTLSVSPSWSRDKKMVITGQWGNHIFYKDKRNLKWCN